MLKFHVKLFYLIQATMFHLNVKLGWEYLTETTYHPLTKFDTVTDAIV